MKIVPPDGSVDELSAESIQDTLEGLGKKGGKGGGKRRKHNSLTSRTARKQSVEDSKNKRINEISVRINNVIDVLLQGISDEKKDSTLKEYMTWVNLCIENGELVMDVNRDIEFSYFRSSGPGGQNVNKVSSAVRVVHIISGIHAESQKGRDQKENREDAFMKLVDRLNKHIEDWKMLKEYKPDIFENNTVSRNTIDKLIY